MTEERKTRYMNIQELVDYVSTIFKYRVDDALNLIIENETLNPTNAGAVAMNNLKNIHEHSELLAKELKKSLLMKSYLVFAPSKSYRVVAGEELKIFCFNAFTEFVGAQTDNPSHGLIFDGPTLTSVLTQLANFIEGDNVVLAGAMEMRNRWV